MIIPSITASSCYNLHIWICLTGFWYTSGSCNFVREIFVCYGLFISVFETNIIFKTYAHALCVTAIHVWVHLQSVSILSLNAVWLNFHIGCSFSCDGTELPACVSLSHILYRRTLKATIVGQCPKNPNILHTSLQVIFRMQNKPAAGGNSNIDGKRSGSGWDAIPPSLGQNSVIKMVNRTQLDNSHPLNSL